MNNRMPLRVIAYVRVSSREQAENSNALEQQIARVKAAGATEIFVDVETGSSDARPNFIKVMKLVKRDEVQEVIVTRIDRLTRKLKTILEIRETFLNSSCNLRALDDSIDISTPAGKFHLSLLGSLAEMEVDRLGERVRHGWQAMRNNKRVAVAPFGYRINDGRLEFDDSPLLCLLKTKKELSTVDIAKDLVQLFFKAKSLRGCLRLFNEKYGIRRYSTGRAGRSTWNKLGFSHSGLSDWLTSPVLLGHTYYPLKRGKRTKKHEWEIYYDTHSPLITIEESYRITEILESNRQVRGFGTNKRRHATSGLVFCDECRSACYSVAGTRGKTPGYNYYYQCKNWRPRSCSQKRTIRVETVEQAIIEALIKKHQEIALRADIDTQPTINHTEEIETLKEQLKGLETLGFNPALDQARREIERQIASLEKQNNQAQRSSNSKYELLKLVFSMPDFWEAQSLEDKTRIYKELVNKVWVREGKVIKIDLKI